MKRVLLSITLLLTILTSMSFGKPGVLNQPAPAWEVDSWHQLPDGKTGIDVSDYKDKVVYLYNFQSWCPGCHSHGFPTLQKLIKKFEGNENVTFVTIQTVFEGFTSNTEDKALQTAKKYNLNIPVGHSGTNGKRSKVMTSYRTGGTPWTVIIDKKGIVRYNDFHAQVEQADTLIQKLLAE